MDKAKQTFILNLIRYTYRWPGKWIATKRSALGGGFYYCEHPDCGVVVKKRFTQLDHIVPVIPVTGFDSLENALDRALPPPEGYMRLCIECHAVKTKAENQQRPKAPKQLKTSKKKKPLA